MAPQANHGDQAKTIVNRIAQLRAWLFLAALIVIFEIWARIDFGGTFVSSAFSRQIGFGFSRGAAPACHRPDTSSSYPAASTFRPASSWVLRRSLPRLSPISPVSISRCRWRWFSGILVAMLAAAVPGLINGLLISDLRVPPFIGTLGMFGVARGTAFLLAGSGDRASQEFLFRRAW